MDRNLSLDVHVQRRSLLAAGAVLLAPGLAWAAAPPGGKLAFAVFRNGSRVGDHLMTFGGPPGAVTVSTDVAMVIKLGPVPVFKYRHKAVERWSGGRFSSLETSTNSGGKQQSVAARRTDAGVSIETGRGRIVAPAATLPLTHWNPQALSGPLFNPQEGKLLKVTARRIGREQLTGPGGRAFDATRWSVRGEAEIDDWYDAAGVWVALRGKLPDGSTMEYRRI